MSLRPTSSSQIFVIGLISLAGSLLLAPLTAADMKRPEPVAEIRHGILQGYLAPDAYPDSLAMLPPPPAASQARHRRTPSGTLFAPPDVMRAQAEASFVQLQTTPSFVPQQGQMYPK